MTDADVERCAARLCGIGFDGLTLPESARELIAAGVGFVVLFARNVASPQQVAALNASIKAAAPGSIAICVDQEGGRVARLREGFTPLPAMRSLGERNDAGLAFAIGQMMGRELRAVGFDVDFAPVLDVDTNPANPVIGSRSFSHDPQIVARLAVQLAAGLQDAGVAACGKHFPGHGDTSQDSHVALPRLDHDLARLEAVELVPFEAAARAGIAAIMTSHIVFTPLDAISPATLSPAVLDGVLRRRLKYDGLVFTDDLEMGAITQHCDTGEAAVRAIEAGADVALICHTVARQRAAIAAIMSAIRSERLGRERLEQSLERIDRLHARYARPVAFTPHVLASSEHRALLDRLDEPTTTDRDPTAYRLDA